ncbi:MAG TPA: YccF domain-containing protein [Acidimicrobiia bacterium]
MRTVGNILWLVLAGFWLAIAYLVAGLVNLILIVTIPFAIQSFKLAGYALWPFGRVVVHRPDRDAALSLLGNVIWFVFGGFWLTLVHLVTGLVLMLTIIGIPMGVANIKMAGLALAPFGKRVVTVKEARAMNAVVVASVASLEGSAR